jgi:hypothetical protein
LTPASSFNTLHACWRCFTQNSSGQSKCCLTVITVSTVTNGCAASRTAGGGARTQYRAFNSSDRQCRGRRSGHRHSEDMGATALNILASPFLWTVRQLIMDRAAALRLPRHLAMARKCRGRRLCCLRTARHSTRPGHYCQTARPAIQRRQGRRHPSRAADQVRAGD